MKGDQLRALAAKVQALTGWCGVTNGEVALANGWQRTQYGSEQRDGWLAPNGHITASPPLFLASLDAAMTLVPDNGGFAVEHERPTRQAMASVSDAGGEPFDGAASTAEAATPALALTADALLALAEQVQHDTH